MGSHVIRVQIGSYVQKAFVDTVHDDVVGADVFHVNGNDPGADLLIKLHPGRGNIVCEFQGRIRCESGSAERGPAEMIFAVVGRFLHQAEPDRLLQALGIDLFDSLHDLEQPGTPGNPMRFQGRGHSQAYCFFGPARIGDDQVRGQGIEAAGCAFC